MIMSCFWFREKCINLPFDAVTKALTASAKINPFILNAYISHKEEKNLLKTEFVYEVLFFEITPVKQFVNKKKLVMERHVKYDHVF